MTLIVTQGFPRSRRGRSVRGPRLIALSSFSSKLHSVTAATSPPIEELDLLEETRRRGGNPVK